MKPAVAALDLLLSCTAAASDGLPPPAAAPRRLALLNGSLVQIVPGGAGNITIVYVRPRVGLLPLVRPGTVLLVGEWVGDQLTATVYGSNPWCGFVPYAVSGSVNADGVLTLVGRAPLIDNASCAVIGFEWNMASTLAFVPWR
jgi:hypothetical protein